MIYDGGVSPSRYFPTEHWGCKCTRLKYFLLQYCDNKNSKDLRHFRVACLDEILREKANLLNIICLIYVNQFQLPNDECLNLASLILDFTTIQLKCLNISFCSTSTCALHLQNRGERIIRYSNS